MIELKNLSKAFGKNKQVIKNLNCIIPDNAIYGLVGANGAGKSTLLRLICSVYKADKGQILIDGNNSFDDELIKKDIVFIPDDLFFFNGYNLLDTAKFYQCFYKNFDLEFLTKESKLLKLDLNKPIANFSKGMKRQCALLCAIACNTKYLFFDETFDGLDPVVRKHFKDLLIKQMTKQDTTIVMASHNLRELEDICDNLGLLYKGAILFEGDIDNLKTNIVKVQISLKDKFDRNTFKDFDILSYKKIGNVATIIIEDNKNIRNKLTKMHPIILDYLPLSLEEIFIYKMEALGYEFNEVI